MTIRTQKTVWCDGLPESVGLWHADGCSMWIGQEDTAGQARQLARQAGWHRSAGTARDYSPECWSSLTGGR